MKKYAILLIFAFSALSCGEHGTYIMNSDDCDGYSDPTLSPYVLPYPAGQTYEVTQGNCGQVTHFGQIRFAYDFNMKEGDSIVAVRAGTVTEVEESNSDSGGDAWYETNYIYIRHDDNTVAAYVHIQEDGVLVEEGDVVSQGQPIALSGNSGTQNPHLHLQVYIAEDKFRSIPITFSNAGGGRYGLVEGESYTAQ